jgi:DNA (cytosine-5)-methyltransferase 1
MFSGIEAASVAWKPLGWECQWVAEIEKFPSAVLAHHYPDVPNLGDVTKVDWEYIRATRPVDCIVFGSPCQSFSVAGKRLGLDDPRGNLALYALSVVNRLRPGWFVFENVPGLLSSGGGRDFGAFLGTVGDIGYQCAWRVLDAQHFGLAQRRARVFVVGHLGDWRRAAAVLFERESLLGNPAPRREAGERVAPTISARPSGGGGLGTDFDCDGGLIPSVSHCLNAGGMGRQDYETETLIAHTLRANGHDASEDGTGRGTPLVPMTFDWQAGGGGADVSFRGKSRSYITDKPGRTRALTANKTLAVAFSAKDHGGDVVVAFNSDQSAKASSWGEREEQSPTLRAGGQISLNQATAVRRLTPRECERLQGFPDDYTLIPYRGKPAADGPRYKALGNSMAVPVMAWIGRRIDMVAT